MTTSEKRTKEEIIADIEALTQEPGFLYSLALILRRDLFLDPEEVADIDWRSRLSFQEVSFLAGLMAKHRIDTEALPTEEAFGDHGKRLYGLFEELHYAYTRPTFEKMLKAHGNPQAPQQSTEEFFADGNLMTEAIFYAGSGAYDFQYLELGAKRYRRDEEWMRTNKGFTFDEIVPIVRHIKKHSEMRWRESMEADRGFPEQCRAALEVFCVRENELDAPEGLASAFLATFSNVPGDGNNPNLHVPGDYNIVDSHPFIRLEDGRYFIPVGFSLAESVYESPFFWMLADKTYWPTAEHNRGDATEELAYEMLVSVFGKDNVFQGVQVKRGDEIVTDIDVLAFAGNRAVIVQAKSKKLTTLAKTGNDDALKKDFQQAVQQAYDQAIKSRSALLDGATKLMTKEGADLPITETIEDAYVICVTSDNYPALTHQTDVYLRREPGAPFPLVMSLFDLDLVSFYLRDPLEFLYYCRQRVATCDYFKASSEAALLALHLRSKLYPRDGVDMEAIDEQFGALIDAHFPAARGEQPKTAAAERLHNKWRNAEFDRLIEQVKAAGPGFTDAVFILFDLAGEGADGVMSMIDRAKMRFVQDGQQHDFSTYSKRENGGITFLCNHDPEQLDKRLYALSAIKKYQQKAGFWLGLGSRGVSPNIVDVVVFSKAPWEYDAALEEAAVLMPLKGKPRRMDGSKVGRNDPCICSSGKKFKRCCGANR